MKSPKMTTPSTLEQKSKLNKAPMFFSVDAILQESLYVLEINKGYSSGFSGLGEDMTYITYLQSCRRPGPIIICARGGEKDSTYEQLKNFADKVLTEDERARTHFISYELPVKKILRDGLEEIKRLSTSEELEQEIFLKENKNKNENEYYDSDDETPQSKLAELRSEISESICESIDDIYFSLSELDDSEPQKALWLQHTPTVILIEPGIVTATSLRKYFQDKKMNYSIDSATIAFELQSHDKALQRVSQKTMMAPAELVDMRLMCQMAYLHHAHVVETQLGSKLAKLWKKCSDYFGGALLTYQDKDKDKSKALAARDILSMRGIAKKSTIAEQKSNRDRIKEETTQYFKLFAQSILQKLEHQAKSSKIPVSQVVLKPTDGFQGQGVIICPADEEKLASLLLQLAECAISTPAEAVLSLDKGDFLLPEIKGQDETTWIMSCLNSLPRGGGWGDKVNIKLKELYAQTVRNTGFFLIEQWIPGQPVSVAGGEKLPTWRFIVETIDNQLTVKSMKEGSQPLEQERRIFGKLPMAFLSDKQTPTTAACVSFIPDSEAKNIKLEDQVFLPDQKFEGELLSQFAKIQQTLQLSLQASFFEYLENLAQSPIEYQQHFQYFILSEKFHLINFTAEDIKEIRQFLTEKNGIISHTLRETLTKIIMYASSKQFKLPEQVVLFDKNIVAQHRKKRASLRKKIDRLEEIEQLLFPTSSPRQTSEISGMLGSLSGYPGSLCASPRRLNLSSETPSGSIDSFGNF